MSHALPLRTNAYLIQRYPEVIRIETDFICASNARLNCFSELPQWTQKLVGGELPHAGDALAELIRKLAG